MLKINKTRLKRLIIISLSSCFCNVYALDSVSSYEKSLSQKTKPVTEVNSDALNQANYDMNQLAKELEHRGWIINKENDGSLVLKLKESTQDTSSKNTSETDQWQQIQKKFNNAGWTAERDSDGSLRLIPQQKQINEPVEKKVPEEVIKTKTTNNNSFVDMQTQLRKKGWDVTNNSDGSILLYPPEQAASTFPKPCYGSATNINIDLPVNTWQEAHDVTQGWLQDNSISDAAVGKIRKIINVYIISIVARTSPHTLQHQVAIRSHDGAVILLN